MARHERGREHEDRIYFDGASVSLAEGRVEHVGRCELLVEQRRWPFAERNSKVIDTHWQAAVSDNPSYFNGRVFMLADGALGRQDFSGVLTAVDFREFLYWRETRSDDATLRDCFGTAVVVSADGKVMLGRQRAGNINAGRTYLPGGFIDERDVDEQGRVDIVASILRELAEETGLNVARGDVGLKREPGFYLTIIGQQVSIGVMLKSNVDAERLQNGVEAYLATDPNGELDAVVFVASEDDLGNYDVPAYARCVVRHLFSS